MDERRQQLLAAAEAVRIWVHSQRATWSDDYPRSLIERRPHAVGPDVAVLAEPAVVFEAMLPAAPSIGLRDRADVVAQWVRDLTSRSVHLVRQSRMAAAIALLTIAGAWTIRAHWSEARALLASNLAAGRHVVESSRRTLSDARNREAQPNPEAAGMTTSTGKSSGQLQVESNPAGARVLVDGRDRGVTPLTIDDLAVGSHKVILRAAEGSIQRTVAIAASRTTQLNEAIFSGWLHVSSPIELQISEGQRAIRLDESNQVLLPPGPHEVRLENLALGFREVRRIEVRPGDTTAVVLEPPPSTISITATETATVTIDGERIGETPLVDYPVMIGTRDVAVTGASGGVRRQTLTVTVQPYRLEVDFSKP